MKDRELDRKVALGIMGWKVDVRPRKDLKDGSTILHWQIENPQGFWWDLELPEKDAASAPPAWWCDPVNVPAYSADLRLAREVLVKLEEAGWTAADPLGEDPGELVLRRGASESRFVIRSRREAPMVMCRAALKAIEHARAK